MFRVMHVCMYMCIYMRKHTEEGHTGKISTFCQEKSYLEREELDGNVNWHKYDRNRLYSFCVARYGFEMFFSFLKVPVSENSDG